MPKSSNVADLEVQVDRRRKDRRELEAETTPTEAKPPRRKKQRRRQIDPTTCERDYNGEEIVFMQALDAYKRSSGRMFPTCSEILEVIRDLGYIKLTEEEKQIFDSIHALDEEVASAAEEFADDEADELLDDEDVNLD